MLTGSLTKQPTKSIPYSHDKRNANRVSVDASAFGAPQGANLGNYSTGFASPKTTEKKTHRYRLQKKARALLPGNKGLMRCMRSLRKGVTYPTIETNGERARIIGLHRCSQGAICPVCAPRIARKAAQQIAAATSKWYAQGGEVIHVTYTLSHGIEESFKNVYSSLSRARRQYFTAGKGYQTLKDRYGIAGSVRALDTTRGAEGWHPHYHELLFLSAGHELSAIEDALKKRWLHAVEKVGGFASEEHGLRVQSGSQAIADYLAKFGKTPEAGGHSVEMELSHSYSKVARKKGKTPFALLDSAYRGDDNDAGLFCEYAGVMRGKPLIRWSKGFLESLHLEADQGALVDGNTGDYVEIAALSWEALKIVSNESLLPQLLVVAVAGFDALCAFLDMYDLMPDRDIDRLFVPTAYLKRYVEKYE